MKLDLAKMQARKGEVVVANVKGVEFLFRKNKVTWLKGAARIAGAGQGRGSRATAPQTYEAKNIVIATGSECHPAAGRRGRREAIVTSTGALALERCRAIWSSSAAASSGWSWARSGAGSAPR